MQLSDSNNKYLHKLNTIQNHDTNVLNRAKCLPIRCINLPLPLSMSSSCHKERGPFWCCLLATLAPYEALEKLFFALFGQTTLSDLNYISGVRPLWTQNLFKFVFGGYLLMSVVVLMSLLIAMMSDTYQRIQVTTCVTSASRLVRSYYEPGVLVRVAILRGVRSDDYRADEGAPQRQQHPASLDQLPVQNRIRNLHAGVGRGADQSAHCYDVRHLPEDTGNIRERTTCCVYAVRICDQHDHDASQRTLFNKTMVKLKFLIDDSLIMNLITMNLNKLLTLCFHIITIQHCNKIDGNDEML